MRVEVERARGRRTIVAFDLDEDSDFDVDDVVDFTGEEGLSLLVEIGIGFLSMEGGNVGE